MSRIVLGLVLIGLVIGAVLTRAYDRDHVSPIKIGQAIPGAPCMITDEKAQNCDFSGFPSGMELSSSVQIGNLTIMQAPPGIESGHLYIKDEHGLHLAPPPPTY